MAERDVQSSDSLKVNITVQGGNVFAPILNKVQGAGNFTFTQNVAGANVSKSETRDVTAVITEYKESVVSMYTYTREYDSLAGEQVLLADRYVDPLIIQQHRIKEEREKEMRSIGNDFFNLKTYDINQSISASNLFSQEHGPNNNCPKAVILQGNSGSGKSVVIQKIMLDWAKGNLFEGIFDVVFHLRCAELNGISEKTSLVELLNWGEEMTPILKDKQKKILFLVDGFDELRCSLPGRPLRVSVEVQAEPGAILSSLLRGTMLKDAFLLVTTRSTSTEQLGKLLKCPQRFTEIMGFSEKGVEEYFLKFFKDTVLSKQVHEQVKTYNTLYTACFSPVMCWLICTSFKQKSNIGTKMTSTFKSTTSIFIDFVFILLEHHCQDLNQFEKFGLLKHLGQLAEDGMRKGEILFARQVVPEIILNRVGLPFLCTFTHKDGVHMKEMFSFLHLSFQEFFAALFYILQDKTEAETKIKQLLLSDSDQFQFSRMAHLFPVIQFLFGLSNKEVINSINEKHEVTREIGSLLVQWMQAFVKSNMVEFYSTFPLHCLHEVNDENVVRNVMKNWEAGTFGVEITLSSSQMSEYHVAAYCLQFCRHIRCLHLHANTVQTLKIMEATLAKCEKTKLTVEHVSDDDVDCLISAVGKVKGLQCLSLYDGSLSDDSVQMIMSHLHEHRSVDDVDLPVKAINHNNTEILMDFLRGKMQPIQLSLNAATSRNKEESLCSHFTINNYNLYKIKFEHKDVDSSVKCILALRYLALDFNSVISNSDLTNLLTISDKLKESDNPKFEEHVDALLSFLRSKPDLTTVMLGAKNLNLNSSAKILTFLQDRTYIETRFEVHHLQCINEENICSLLLSTASLFFANSDMLLLEVHSSSFQDSHETESNPELLQLSLMFPPIKAATVNWVDLFQLITQMMKSKQRQGCTE
ncbi:NACHT, LRR and PYD domains-containing protein 1 homolog [Clarias gariepinus]|uniref:NACHT, LRR and PYD domains-containing protein 1 homolog n=1 Tax=Clarias gariepinus TaxID=13013 RepID=UPI00234C24D8|nr:NACHT, LRR and PYD domains-containing protein 1 homolog [Clarias gariepinus]